ncbi:MAG TPA: 4-hydroxy-tetrahydrodipicolinate synthase [Polyangiaceae bacterium]|jgi:4-hydroxy-tetrahydrodipicolinate synthase|nr:4-hydroxy-tetrahydrodipicolinate synthase [Polyangiaceae bacterium]
MLRGSLIALVTPMAPTGDIDWDALAALVEWHIECRSDGLVAVGTTGESPTVDFAEHKKVMAFMVERAKKRIPVVGGTGANATREAIALTLAAKEVGCDACLSVTPYYNKPTQEGLYLHYKAIAEAVAIPQFLYNVPGRTCCDLLAPTALRLAKVPNIAGIKEATGDMARAKEILEGRPKGFAVYSGDDATARELMLLGGDGSISVTANLMPLEYRQMCEAALKGDAGGARAIDQRMEELHKVLFTESSPIPVKWALAEMGRIGHAIRLPLTTLSEQKQPAVRAALVRAGLIAN